MKEKLKNEINFDLLGDITPSLLPHKSGITVRIILTKLPLLRCRLPVMMLIRIQQFIMN